jgi:hypothetical protein
MNAALVSPATHWRRVSVKGPGVELPLLMESPLCRRVSRRLNAIVLAAAARHHETALKRV